MPARKVLTVEERSKARRGFGEERGSREGEEGCVRRRIDRGREDRRA
jgi:hypothetical protein